MAYDKAVNSAELDSCLDIIATALRAKAGTSESLRFPDDFVSLIESIQTGGGSVGYAVGGFTAVEETAEIEVTHNLGKIPAGALCISIGTKNMPLFATFMWVLCGRVGSINFGVITPDETSKRNYFAEEGGEITGGPQPFGAFNGTTEKITFGGTQKYSGKDICFRSKPAAAVANVGIRYTWVVWG